MIGFLHALSLIAIIAQAAYAHANANAYEHSHRDLYKSRAHPHPRHEAKHRPRNFTLVDRYEGKTFFECVVVPSHPLFYDFSLSLSLSIYIYIVPF
jgi:hypothetical protein